MPPWAGARPGRPRVPIGMISASPTAGSGGQGPGQAAEHPVGAAPGHREQRPGVPVPGLAFGGLGSALRSARFADLSPELVAFLTYGRGVDTTRMRSALGFEPRYPTAEAFGEFASTLPPTGGRTERLLGAVAERLPEVSDDRPPALTLAGGHDG